MTPSGSPPTADVTGGIFFNAKGKPLSALDAIVETIRGYQ